MNKTSIEWVKNPDGRQGYTWNPITGCLNGCPYCYARALANTRLRERYLANKNIAISAFQAVLGKNPFYPRFWKTRLDDLNPVYGQDTRAMLKGIFVCDMSDLFGTGVPEEWTQSVIERIREFTYHRFYLLTKQPQNLAKFSPFPNNCWVGVTVCNNKMLDAAVDKLEDIQACVKYISFEPLLSRLTLSLDYAFYYSGIKWCIIGAQTKPYKPPKIEWVKEIVEAADKAGVKVFLKNNLKPILIKHRDNNEYAPLWANGGYGTLRQEMPA